MKISDPATAITDYILALECSIFGVLLFLGNQQQWSIFLWSLAFLALGISAMSGGIYHHLRLELSPIARNRLWQLTAISIVATLFLFLAGGAIASVAGALKTVLLLLTAAGFVASLLWMRRLGGAQFGIKRSVPILFAIMIGLIVLLLQQWLHHGAQSGKYILIASIVCTAGVMVQQAAPRVHRHFNHNDLCHVIFMAGLYFLFRGGMLLKDKPW